MKDQEQLTIVGGGSAYAPGLISAFLKHKNEHSIKKIKIYDLNGEHARLIQTLCANLSRSWKSPITVSAHPTLDEALEGSHYVLNSARPGGLEARHVDETLPLDLHIPGQETVGPGGFFFAMRSIPEALHLCQRMTQICPTATLLNYTNPTNIVTQCLSDNSPISAIGLCDQSDEDIAAIAEALGLCRELSAENTSFNCVGLNHATWYTDIRIGEHLLTQEDIQKSLPTPQDFDHEHALRFQHSRTAALANPGYWPNSYLPYYWHPEDFVTLSQKEGNRAQVILQKLPEYYEHFEQQAQSDNPILQKYRGSAGFGDMAFRILRALGGYEDLQIVLNGTFHPEGTPFHKDTVTECMVSVSGQTLTPQSVPSVPEGSRMLLKQLERYQRMTSQVLGSTFLGQTSPQQAARGLLEALAQNPLVHSESKAQQLIQLAKVRYAGLIDFTLFQG